VWSTAENRKTHELVVLLDADVVIAPLWEAARSRLETLTNEAVLFRYPGESATRALAKTAIADASWARGFMRTAMRLRGR